MCEKSIPPTCHEGWPNISIQFLEVPCTTLALSSSFFSLTGNSRPVTLARVPWLRPSAPICRGRAPSPSCLLILTLYMYVFVRFLFNFLSPLCLRPNFLSQIVCVLITNICVQHVPLHGSLSLRICSVGRKKEVLVTAVQFSSGIVTGMLVLDKIPITLLFHLQKRQLQLVWKRHTWPLQMTITLYKQCLVIHESFCTHNY